MSNKDLVIINNEKITKDKNTFYCENIDIKSITEDLSKSFNVHLIARSSKKSSRIRKIDLKNINISSNIFSFLYNIVKTFKRKETIYLIISITPYTFFSYIFLFFFKKKTFVYLRSSGHEEYKAILGFIGPIIYHIMFKFVTFKSNVISAQARLFSKRKSHIVSPSELNTFWLNNTKKPKIDIPRLLYVGRMKVEKGIFSLTKIVNEIQVDLKFSIVGGEPDKFSKNAIKNEKIFFYPFQNETNSLIRFYDESNIFILPSFTEAHPKVLDESLARVRPVIIFEDIQHIIQDRKGIFVSKRNAKSLEQTIEYIIKNYEHIQKDILENSLPTRKDFILQMNNILRS